MLDEMRGLVGLEQQFGLETPCFRGRAKGYIFT